MTIIDTAARHGWRLIQLNGKIPKAKGWQNSIGLSPEQARKWQDQRGNLGIICGELSNRLFVVDIDGDRPDGLPDTPAVQTSKGLHLYYRLPDHISLTKANKVGKVAPGVDIRWTGGQVVAPESVHPDTGLIYEWVEGQSPDDIPMAAPPQWIIDALTAPRPKPAAAARPASQRTDLHPFIQGNITRAVDNVRNAPPHTGNDTLNVETYGLAGWLELSEDYITNIMMAADGGRRSEHEARATIASAIAGGRSAPRTVPASTTTTTAASLVADIMTRLPDDVPFSVLGHYNGKYYFLPHDTGQIADFTATALAQETNLYRIADESWWLGAYQTEGKIAVKKAAASLMANAHKRGLFDKARIRGRGAWHDEGRIVLHRGESLLVDGIETKLSGIKSRNVYQHDKAIAIPYQNPLTTEEAQDGILALCNALCWEKPIFGNLLAGWLALAPICGVLDWRPHIWITGQSGTGKSYIQDEIIPILGSMVIFVQGCSTEAGVRQTLGADALAVSFDESEPDGFKASARIGHILELARQASSSKGGMIAKGTASGEAQLFNIRSMFCMSSVAVGLARRSDMSRFTVLSMAQPPHGAEGLARFQQIQELAAVTCDGPMADRFVARSCHMAATIIKSARVFSEVFCAMKTNRRNADQIGALLAGYWSLVSDEPATPEDARIIVNDIDLDGVTPEADSNDEAQFLSHLMAKRIRCDVADRAGHTTTVERTISELINTAVNFYDAGEDAGLQRHGMRCLEDGLFIASQHPGLADLLDDTQWSADWKRFVGRVPGAVKDSQRLCNKVYRGHKIDYNSVFGAE